MSRLVGLVFLAVLFGGPLVSGPSAVHAASIRTLNSGHCLAIDGGIDQPDGTPLVIMPCDNSPSQNFRMPGDGTLQVGERCVDAKTAQGNPGDPLVIWPCHKGANQRWELMGLGQIRGINFLCMDVKGGGGEGTSVMVWRCHGGRNQRWSIE